jgi:hypothetical protein
MGTPASRAVLGAAACAAAMIAGCGSSGPLTEPTPAALIASMQASVRQANSVHVTGHLANNGVPISVNLSMHRNGDVAGTESLNGAPFQVIGVHGSVYVKATRSFLQEVRAPASACAVACGKWLLVTPALASQLTSDFSMSNFTGPLTSPRLPKFTTAGSTIVGGHRVWALRSGDGVTLDVSSASPHYPLAATAGGSASELVMYTQWNTAPQPVAPPANEVLPLNNLK